MAWGEAASASEDLLEIEENSSLYERVRSYWSKPHRLKHAVISLSNYEINDILARASIARYFNEHVTGDFEGIRAYIEKAIDNFEKYPSSELRELLHFLESRRHHADKLLIALLAAVVGGLVGGLLTALAM